MDRSGEVIITPWSWALGGPNVRIGGSRCSKTGKSWSEFRVMLQSDLTDEERFALLRRFSSKKSYAKKKNISFQFESAADFVEWWQETLLRQKGGCAYCETPIRIIKRLIDLGSIQARNGRKPGARGPKFEIDRKNGSGPYSKNNCVLACLYCNNDKSNIYDDLTYKMFFGSARNKHFRHLSAEVGLSWDE